MTAFTDILIAVKAGSHALPRLSASTVNAVLRSCGWALVQKTRAILAANRQDLARLTPGTPLHARLELSAKKIQEIAGGFGQVARLPSPLKRVLEARTLKNGLKLSRVTVPLGVIGVIFESRPNVAADIFALCFKSGNACVLKGGSEAKHSSAALVKIIRGVLVRHHLNPNALHLVTGGRREAQRLLKARGLIDLVIPRGGAGLINYVRSHAAVPVIETGAGVVHNYVDATVDINQAARLIYNAKTNRPAACNALDTLLVHRAQLKNLRRLLAPLAHDSVLLYADRASFRTLSAHYPKALLQHAAPKHFGVEFLSLSLAVKTVRSLDEALAHIAAYGSGHSEAILSKNQAHIERFLGAVDAAAVYANAATTLTDGGVFGLGAEVGISTQKLHARGPMGLPALTSYKWVARGSGQVRI